MRNEIVEAQKIENYLLYLLEQGGYKGGGMKEKIISLEKGILQEEKKYPDIKSNIPIEHHIGGGMYAREAFMPQGTICTGKVHKYDHICVVSKGKISVATIDGVMTIEAPYTFVSKAGTKRAAYVHEDTLWTTIHRSDLTTVEEIEEEQTCVDFLSDKELLEMNA